MFPARICPSFCFLCLNLNRHQHGLKLKHRYYGDSLFTLVTCVVFRWCLGGVWVVLTINRMENKISLQISAVPLHGERRKLKSHTFSQCLFKTQSNMSGSSVWDMLRIYPLKRNAEQLTAFTFHVGTHCALCFGTFPFFS